MDVVFGIKFVVWRYLGGGRMTRVDEGVERISTLVHSKFLVSKVQRSSKAPVVFFIK